MKISAYTEKTIASPSYLLLLADPSSDNYKITISNFTGQLTGSYLTSSLAGNTYYLKSNPSGFITTGETGTFLSSSNTGNFIVVNDVRQLNFASGINITGYLGVGKTTVSYPVDVNGNLRASGFFVNCVLVSGNYTGLSTDYIIEQQKENAIITLSSALGLLGKIIVIKNSTSGNIDVVTTSPELLDGGTGTTLSSYNSITIYSNNTNWRII